MLGVQMSQPPSASRQRQRESSLSRLGWGFTFIASVVGLAWMITTAIRKVLSGEGLDTFRTTWLVEFNWVGFLVLLIAVVIAFVISLFFFWRGESTWRDL